MLRNSAGAFALALTALAAAGFADDGSGRRAAMIKRIDGRLAERWEDLQITPAPRTDDAEFLRRVHLDLKGVIPRVHEVRSFLADTRPDKRQRLIDDLLKSPAHATHLANTWRKIMLPGNVSGDQANNVVGVQNWLYTQFAKNLRYDRLVGDLLVSTGGGDTGPALYYTAMDLEPEKLAGSTARIFLGIQMECAQCHDHPFDRWTQRDFWGYAAFFAQLEQPQSLSGNVLLIDRNEGDVTLPETEEVVPPQYPGGLSAAADARGTRRVQLAIWMASRDNPYLARAAVNRVWAHLFGRGLVEPVDDLGPHNPPSHPELMDELAEYFADSGFDLRELFRTLAQTDAYQRSSRMTEDIPEEAFARMAIKSLTAAQLYDSLNRSLGRLPTPAATAGPARFVDLRRQAFIAQMASLSRSPTIYDSGVPQALTLMNGGDINEATQVGQGGLLTSLQATDPEGAALFDDRERVRILFMATLSRLPGESELSRFTGYLAGPKTESERGRALGDILWALLNSAEFTLNH